MMDYENNLQDAYEAMEKALNMFLRKHADNDPKKAQRGMRKCEQIMRLIQDVADDFIDG